MAITMDMEDMKNGIGEIRRTGIIGITTDIWNMMIGIAGDTDMGGMKIFTQRGTIAKNGRRRGRGEF